MDLSNLVIREEEGDEVSLIEENVERKSVEEVVL